MTEHAENQDHPGVIAPPPLILLAAVLIGIALNAIWPLDVIAWPAWTRFIGWWLIGFGAVLLFWSAATFRRADTNLQTRRPATTIVRTGPYGLSRNPIYTGFILAFLGLASVLGNTWMLLLSLPLFLTLRFGVVAREEAYLESKFGEAYSDYKRSVRRWL